MNNGNKWSTKLPKTQTVFELFRLKARSFAYSVFVDGTNSIVFFSVCIDISCNSYCRTVFRVLVVYWIVIPLKMTSVIVYWRLACFHLVRTGFLLHHWVLMGHSWLRSLRDKSETPFSLFQSKTIGSAFIIEMFPFSSLVFLNS